MNRQFISLTFTVKRGKKHNIQCSLIVHNVISVLLNMVLHEHCFPLKSTVRTSNHQCNAKWRTNGVPVIDKSGSIIYGKRKLQINNKIYVCQLDFHYLPDNPLWLPKRSLEIQPNSTASSDQRFLLTTGGPLTPYIDSRSHIYMYITQTQSRTNTYFCMHLLSWPVHNIVF